jgi:transcription elongation factor Elf1
MKDFEVDRKSCRNCGISTQLSFFVYTPENERYDKWLDSVDNVKRYCDKCFHDTPKVILFIECFCAQCSDYTGIYLECTPHSKVHLLTEKSAKSQRRKDAEDKRPHF